MNNNGYTVELVTPSSDASPVKNTLKKNGEGPYHICYESENIDFDIEKFLQEGYIIVQPKSNAIAFNNKNVIFMFKKGIGLIEVLEKEGI
jgi:methylmalonyl-CoA/ethylmalonyl-CoA epimerase